MHHDAPRNISSKKQGFHSDQAWAHWEYSPEEWAVFDRIDWQAAWRRYWFLNLAPVICIFILSVVFIHDVVEVVFSTLMFGLTFAVVPFVVGGFSYREAKKRHRARQDQTQPHRVTFSKEGVWEAGTFFPLGGSGLFGSLRGVRMTSQPTVLHFRRRTLINRNTHLYYTLRVLVPHGYEDEATQLAERFRTEVIRAKQQTTYNPPEPV